MIRRMILKTKDGQVIVRPQATDTYVRLSDTLLAKLSDTGKDAWNAGEALSFEAGHFLALGDRKGIKKANFN